MKKYNFPLLISFLATLFFFFITGDLFATHNRAGEITYRKIGNNRYEATIVTYTKTSSPADRPELEFWWGDGNRDTLPRASIQFQVGPDIQRNVYYGQHTFPGNGTYTMYFLDENRNAAVINIPGSVLIPFYVETSLVISPFVAVNNSPQLLEPPIDDGAINSVFIHNPNAYDPDGDSLSYELTSCKGVNGAPIPGYTLPIASSSFTLDAVTGELVWDSPVQQGEYNVAIIVREWRNIPGIGMYNIGYVTRDMQITIYPPLNNPPQITSVKDTCVEAGASIAFSVSANDPDNDSIYLTASGGPFSVTTSPATFTNASGLGTVSGNFLWNTNCAHVRRNPYTVVFKAKDNNQDIALADLQQLFITVVAPSPKNPTVVPQGNALLLNWDQSICSQAIGYKIYRRTNTYGFIPSQCETGVPAYTGYVLAGTVNGLATTTYLDNNGGAGLSPAVDYCYMVTAFYSDGAESYASVEFCGILKRDLPVITNADVTATSNSTGSIYVAWGKPTEIDLVQTPGPFRYVLQRTTGTAAFTDVVTFTSLNDTIYNDGGLNTSDNQYRYRVQFWNDTPGNTFQIGNSQTASSIYLSIAPADEKNILNWNLSVPWLNTEYIIYRQTSGGPFDSIDVSNAIFYTDDSLVNGTEYCYYIRSIGLYSDSGLVNPIINRSEIFCSVPVDNEAPCPPVISQVPNCPLLTDSISWTLDSTCAFDVAEYRLFRASSLSGTFNQVATIPAGTNLYVYTNSLTISGCYYMVSVDSVGNVGIPSNQLCVESCPTYTLPNVFTPDNNGINDLFHPFHPYRDVRDIEIEIFNRWGSVMFKTTDPEISWNGKKDNTGQEAPDGVYYYVCKVNEIYLEEVRQRVITGFVHIIRGGLEK